LFWPKKKDKTGANKNNLNQLGQGLILFDTVEEAGCELSGMPDNGTD
jgi:hypothetical protein